MKIVQIIPILLLLKHNKFETPQVSYIRLTRNAVT